MAKTKKTASGKTIVKHGSTAVESFGDSPLFDTERALVDYIYQNASDFCLDHFGVNYQHIEVEKQLDKQCLFAQGRTRRIDIYIILEDGRSVAIECKRTGGNTRQAIGQILEYGLEGFDELVLVLGTFDHFVLEVVDKYLLPVRVIYLKPNFTMFYGKS